MCAEGCRGIDQRDLRVDTSVGCGQLRMQVQVQVQCSADRQSSRHDRTRQTSLTPTPHEFFLSRIDTLPCLEAKKTLPHSLFPSLSQAMP